MTNKKLNYKKMVEKIDELVNNDFCADMEMKQFSNPKYTKKEIKKMVDIIGKIYSISHCISCLACSGKYRK